MSETQLEKKAVWQKHIEAYLSSGLSKRAYCKVNDLNYHTFSYHWKQRSKKSAPKNEGSLKKFMTVKLSSEQQSQETLTIHFPNGIHLQLPMGAKAIHLKELIKALKS